MSSLGKPLEVFPHVDDDDNMLQDSTFYVKDMGAAGIRFESSSNPSNFLIENMQTNTLESKKDESTTDFQDLSTWIPIEVECDWSIILNQIRK